MVTKKGADKPADCNDLIEKSVLCLSNVTLISSHLKLKHMKAEGGEFAFDEIETLYFAFLTTRLNIGQHYLKRL